MLLLKGQQANLFDIWNKSQPYLGKTIALMLGDLYYLETMMAKIDEAKDGNNKRVLEMCTVLWTLVLYRED